MSDRHQMLYVVLERETRDDDLEPILRAIRMVRGVATVATGKPMSAADYMVRATVMREFTQDVAAAMDMLQASDANYADLRAELEAVLFRFKKKRGY